MSLLADSIARVADLNLAGSLRHFADHSPGAASAVVGGVALVRAPHSYPGAYTNGAVRIDTATPAEEAIATAQEFFARPRRPFALWTREGCDDDLIAAARAGGWHERPPADGMPAMVIEEPVAPARPPGGIRIEPVADERAARDYLLVVAGAYGLHGIDVGTAAGMFFHPGATLADGARTFIAYVGSVPAAGAMTVAAEGAAGIYWAATLPAARGRGIGEACARCAVNAGFELGARLVALQSSQMGRGLWRKLGFREVGRYRRFLWSASRSNGQPFLV